MKKVCQQTCNQIFCGLAMKEQKRGGTFKKRCFVLRIFNLLTGTSKEFMDLR
jgi:hypothetical protein